MTTERMGDGGAAFPERAEDGTCYSGATLRDYFAAKAMQASLGNPLLVERFGANPADVATAAYEYADAMLAARSQP